MTIYILLFCIIILWIITLYFSKDIFCPSSILCVSYIVALLSAIYNIERWSIDLHLNTFLIILFGLIIFIITSFIYKSKVVKSVKKDGSNLKYIEIKRINVLIAAIVSFVISFIYLYFFFKTIDSFSASTFSGKMEIYRNKINYEGMVYIPTLINFFSKFCRALATIYMYILINNILYNSLNKEKKNKKNYILYVLGIISYIPLSICSGARFDLIVFFITGVMIWFFLYVKVANQQLKTRKIFKILIIFVFIAGIFSSSRNLVGRTNTSNFLDYFTQYFGGSIHIFDVYMQENHQNTGIFGQELFSGIRKLLDQLNVIDNRNVSKDIGKFIYTEQGEAIGNVYTAYRNMYHDFGYVGIVFFQIILAIFFNSFYYKILNKSNKITKNNNIDLGIIIYSTISYCLFFHSYSEYFFCTVLSFNYIMLFIMIYFTREWLIKVKV